MKILRLTLENLASLKGRNEIDFTRKVFTDDGLFLITGATGSGKSTLLDAICLALYHCTPRQKKVTKAANELMTRGAGSCLAEVEFAVGGKGYRASFRQRRARDRADGTLQDPCVELACLDGTVLTTAIGEKLVLVERLTGLDFTRFTRSILLAQGEFASFLRASPGETAALLEELTGTEIYANLSIAAFRRAQESAAGLRSLQDRLQGIQLLDAAQRALLEQEVREAANRRDGLRQVVNTAQALCDAHRQAGDLRRQVATLQEEGQRHAQESLARQPELERLAQAERALPVQSHSRRLTDLLAQRAALVGQQEERNDALARRQQAVREDGAELLRLATAVQEGGLALQALERRLSEEVKPLDRDIQRLVQEQAVQAAEVNRADTACQRELAAEATSKSRLEALQRSLAASEIRLLELPGAEEWLRQWPAIEECRTTLERRETEAAQATAELCRMREAVVAAQSRQADMSRRQEILHAEVLELESARAQAATAREGLLDGMTTADWQKRLQVSLRRREQLLQLAAVQIGHAENRQRLDAVQVELTATQTTVQALASGIEVHEARLERARERLADRRLIARQQERIASLEAQRQHLVTGEPCPLCGSTDHPWQRDGAPLTDTAGEAVERAEAEVRAEEGELARQSTERVRQETRGEGLRASLATLEADLRRLRGQADGLASQVGLSPDPLDTAACQVALNTGDEAIARLERRLEHLATLDSGLADMNKRLEGRRRQEAESASEKQAADAALDRDQSLVEGQAQRIERMQHDLLTLRERLRDLVGSESLTADVTPAQRRQVLDAVQTAIAEYRGLQEQRVREAEERLKLSSELEGRTALVALRREQSVEAVRREQETREQLRERRRQRLELLPEAEDADAWLSTQRTAWQAIEQHRKERDAAHRGLQAEVERISGEVVQLALSMEQLDGTLTTARQAFEAALTAAGFASPQAFHEAALSEPEVLALRATATRLRDEGERLRTLREGREADLRAVLDRLPPEQTPEAAETELASLQAALEVTIAAVAEGRQKLAADDDARRRNQDLLGELVAARDRHEWLERLSDLIGSASGQKFRAFAQGLTLDNLLCLANSRLAILHGRYRLQRRQGAELALEVVDAWQGDAVRDTSTLSGGESFLVSLALALGLSDLVSERSIDSLFLDEGFGTLDAETLETALEALDRLNATGKMIGVISHVDALKERIRVQIRTVSARGAGESRLELPA